MRKELLVKVISSVVSGAVVLTGAAIGVSGNMTGSPIESSAVADCSEVQIMEGKSVLSSLLSTVDGCDPLSENDRPVFSEAEHEDEEVSQTIEVANDEKPAADSSSEVTVNALAPATNTNNNVNIAREEEIEVMPEEENDETQDFDFEPEEDDDDDETQDSDFEPAKENNDEIVVVRTAPSSVSTTNTSALAKEAFDLINNYRVANGIETLKWSDTAAAVASVRAKELVADFSHSSVSGANKGYGENIALTYSGSASEVVNLWINSPGHKANILRKSYATAGLAVYKVGGAYYWSNNFATSGKAPKEGDKGTTTEQRDDGTKVTRDEDGNIALVYGEPKLGADGWTVNSYPLEIEIQEKVVEDKEIGEKTHYYILSKVWVELRLASSYHATCAETREEAENEICTLADLKFTYKDNGRRVKAHYTNGELDGMKFV